MNMGKRIFEKFFLLGIFLFSLFLICGSTLAACSVSDCHTTGGAITTSGNYCIHKFTSSGTFTVPSGTLSGEVLVVAGGGGGGGEGGGGGGAGGYLTGTQTLAGSMAVTVGGGGAGSIDGGQGGNSAFGTRTSIGGGGGGTMAGFAGGSGGGCGSYWLGSGGAGTAGQGNKGGDNSARSSFAGGGGGAGAAGGAGGAGNGGAGITSSISGSSVGYAGGGGGGSWTGTGGTATHGGGASGTAGAANTGGGGGGNGGYGAGANGGSGIVIVRYYQNTTNGVWSGFGAWYDTSGWSVCSSCSQSKSQRRDRTCTPPVCGGTPCLGLSYEIQSVSQSCGLVDGVWSGFGEWYDTSSWGPCLSCISSKNQKRDRTCTPPVCSGADCIGESFENKVITKDCCASTNSITDFNATLDGNKMRITYSCLNDSPNSGLTITGEYYSKQQTITCTSTPESFQIIDESFSQNKILQLGLIIQSPCETCSKTIYLSVQKTSGGQTPVPDYSLISILSILAVVFFILRKKS